VNSKIVIVQNSVLVGECTYICVCPLWPNFARLWLNNCNVIFPKIIFFYQVSGKEKEYTATVVEVVNGDALMVKTADGMVKKIFLASIRPPREQRSVFSLAKLKLGLGSYCGID
jgi:endonuclease YncB( thermonuclease family)